MAHGLGCHSLGPVWAAPWRWGVSTGLERRGRGGFSGTTTRTAWPIRSEHPWLGPASGLAWRLASLALACVWVCAPWLGGMGHGDGEGFERLSGVRTGVGTGVRVSGDTQWWDLGCRLGMAEPAPKGPPDR